MNGDAQVDDLYRELPANFIASRAAVVAELKASGDTEAAQEVRALRKPSAAAWAINRLALDEPELIEDLVQATEALAEAHQSALGGGSGLREAARERQRALGELTTRAAKLLRQHKVASSDQSEVIAGTLDAATVDPTFLDLLRRGRLTRELERPDLLTAFRTGPADLQTDREQALRDEYDDREQELEDARRLFDEAAHAAENAREELATAEDRLERARRQAEKAEARADEAGAAAKKAEEALERARAKLG